MFRSSKHKNRISILYVDQAVGFGGSLVVLGQLIHAINRDSFRPTMVGEMDLSELGHHIQDAEKVYTIRRIFNYVLWAKTTNIADKIPLHVFKKIIIYAFSLIRSIFNSVYGIRFALAVIKERVDIVHINNGINNFAPALAAMLLRRKYVIHFHGVEQPGALQRVVLNRANKLIFISDYLKNEFISNGIPGDNAVVIPNPVVPKPVEQKSVQNIRLKYGIQDDELVFGIVGRIVPWKGHIQFLRAASVVLKSLPKVKAIIVGDYSDGDASYQSHVQKVIQDERLDERVIATGYVSNVEEFYSVMDVLLHCSIEPEPFGLVITEAMSYGVPVIASDKGAPKEIIQDGLTGFIVNPENTSKLSTTLSNLLRDEQLRTRISTAAKNVVLSNYNIHDYANSFECLYKNVINK